MEEGVDTEVEDKGVDMETEVAEEAIVKEMTEGMAIDYQTLHFSTN